MAPRENFFSRTPEIRETDANKSLREPQSPRQLKFPAATVRVKQGMKTDTWLFSTQADCQ